MRYNQLEPRPVLKVNFCGSDSVKRLWKHLEEEYQDKYVLRAVQQVGGRVMVRGLFKCGWPSGAASH